MNHLERLDFFGQKFTFTLFKEERHKTYLGTVLTMAILIVGLSFTFVFGSDFFNKTNPIIAYQTVVSNNYTKSPLNEESFLIPWALYDSNENFLNTSEKIFAVWYYLAYQKFPNGSIILMKNYILNYTKCDKKYDSILSGISNYNCNNFTFDNLTFGGGWDGDFVEYFYITLSYCPNGNNYSPDGNCTSLKDLNTFFGKGIYFGFFYPSLLFQGNNVSNPLNVQFTKYYYNLGMPLNKWDRFYFQKAYLFDDQGLVLKDNKTSSVFYGNQIKTDYSIFPTDFYNDNSTSTAFYVCLFYMNKNYDLYTRSYMKFQNLSAIIGGFINIIQIICSFINKIFNNSLREQKLIKEAFDFNSDIDLKKLNKIKKSFDAERQSQLILINNKPLDDKIGDMFDHSVVKKLPVNEELNISRFSKIIDHSKELKDYLKNNQIKKKNLKNFPGIILILKNRFLCKGCLKNEQIKLLNAYNIGRDFINSRLDVIHYLNTLEIIDKIRMIIFNKKQNLSLNHMNRHNLLNSENLEILKSFIEGEKFSDISSITNYFIEKLEKNTLTDIDLKVYNSLEPGLQKFILDKKTT